MAFIAVRKGKYHELIENYFCEKTQKRRERVLYYFPVGKKMMLPRSIVRQHKISRENLKRLREKYPELRVVGKKL